MIVAISVAAAVLVIGVIIGCVLLSNSADSGLILEGVSVAGVDVGGMTKTDAISAVRLATGNTYTTQTMVVKIEDHSAELTPTITGAKLDVEAAVEAAYNYGRTGNRSEQQQQQQTAQTSGYIVDLEPYLNLDAAAIRLSLNGLGSHFVGTLSQSTWEITTNEDDKQVLVINIGTPEYALDLQWLYDQVMEAYSKNLFLVEADCPSKEPDPVDLDTIYAEYCTAPVDASWDEEASVFIEEADGYGFHLEETRQLLENAEYGSTVEIIFDTIKPAVTVEELSKELFADTLASYTATDKSSDANRNVNLDLACKAINGIILYPGDVFSYNDTLGPRTPENGYKKGPSYAGDETLMTYGGGICQVSSALYYCAMVADLEIVERYNHGFTTNYVPLGMDATVDWDSRTDFKFSNNTDTPIRIEATANGGSVTVKLIGMDDKDYYIKMEYKVIRSTPYGTTHEYMKENNSEGYRDGDVIEEGYTGYVVETYRCKYDKETDSLISRDLEAESTYRMRNQVVCKIEGSSGTGSGGIGSGNASESNDDTQLPADPNE